MTWLQHTERKFQESSSLPFHVAGSQLLWAACSGTFRTRGSLFLSVMTSWLASLPRPFLLPAHFGASSVRQRAVMGGSAGQGEAASRQEERSPLHPFHVFLILTWRCALCLRSQETTVIKKGTGRELREETCVNCCDNGWWDFTHLRQGLFFELGG